MSSWVRRTLATDGIGPRAGWTGPIRSPRQAEKEAAAWRSVGWTAVVEESSPEIKAEVRAWQKRVRAARR